MLRLMASRNLSIQTAAFKSPLWTRVYIKHQTSWRITRKNIRKIQYSYVLLWVMGRTTVCSFKSRETAPNLDLYRFSSRNPNVPKSKGPDWLTSGKKKHLSFDYPVPHFVSPAQLTEFKQRGELQAANRTAWGSKQWDAMPQGTPDATSFIYLFF